MERRSRNTLIIIIKEGDGVWRGMERKEREGVCRCREGV